MKAEKHFIVIHGLHVICSPVSLYLYVGGAKESARLQVSSLPV